MSELPNILQPASNTTPPAPAPCPRCDNTDRRSVQRVFRDGTIHHAEECAECGRHFKFVPRRRQSTPKATTAPAPMPDTTDLRAMTSRAFAVLRRLDNATQELRDRLMADDWNGIPWDAPTFAGILAACSTAAALLAVDAIDGRAARMREGRAA